MGGIMRNIGMTGTAFPGIVLYLLAAGTVAAACAETGMGLVSTNTAYQDMRIGPIYRIDISNDTVKAPTSSLGNGTCPRFSPDGREICFLKNGANTVSIITVDGQLLRQFSVVGLQSGISGTLSWTNGGIWVGAVGSIVKYDTLGTQLTSYATGGNQRWPYVSRNEITAGGVEPWKPWIYNMRRNHNFAPGISGDGCSVCPSPNGLLITNNLADSPTGNGYHRTMRILDTLGSLVRYLNIQDITKFNSGYLFDMQCWSGNSNDWILIPVGYAGGAFMTNCSPCIYNIATGQKFCLKDNSGTGNQWQPFDYYSGWIPTTTGPALQLSPSALSFAADSGSSNPSNQTVTASTPTGTLSGLAVSGANPGGWLTATAAGSSGASITITNTATMGNRAPGTYLDTIIVSTGNAGTRSCIVTLTIRRPPVTAVLTSLAVSPSQYTVAAGSSVNFLTTCKDQSGKYFTTATIMWTASGGGAIDPNGRFSASATPTHGPHCVIATAVAGGVTLHDTAWLMVSRAKNESVHTLIDCGSNSFLPAGWQTDDAYDSAGTDYDLAGTIATAGIPAAAPANVYKSVRRGNPHAYKIAGVPSGFFYTTRLHLVDWKDTARLMSYSILGTNVLRDFSISPVAGGANKPLVLDFTELASDTIVPISCSAAAGDVFEAGLEVMQNFLKPVTLLSPQGGANQKFQAGRALPVQFRNDTLAISQMFIELSVDGGRNFSNVTGTYGIFMSDSRSTWGNYNWTIPDSVGDAGSRVSTISTRCRIRVRPYNNMIGGFDLSDSNFTIAQNATVIGSAMQTASAGLWHTMAGGRLVIRASSSISYRIDLFSVKGDRRYSSNGIGMRDFEIPRAEGAGIMLLRMATAKGTTSFTFVNE